jgi:signal transduction histidine kinase
MVDVQRDAASDRRLLQSLLEELEDGQGRSDAFSVYRRFFRRELDLELQAIGLTDRAEGLSLYPQDRESVLTPPRSENLLSDGPIHNEDGCWYPVEDHLGFLGVLLFELDPENSYEWERVDALAPVLLTYYRRLEYFGSASSREELSLPSHQFLTEVSERTFQGLEEIFQSTVESISRIFNCDNCRLFWRESPDILRLRAEQPATEDLDTELIVSKDPVIQQVIEEEKSILINDLPESADSLHESANLRSFLSAPLSYEGQVRGTINLSSRTADVYTREDLERFTAFCDHLSTVFASTRELVDLTRYVDKVMRNLPVGVLTYRIQSDDLHLNREARDILGFDEQRLPRDQFEAEIRNRLDGGDFLELLDINERRDRESLRRYELHQEGTEPPRIIKAFRNTIRDSEDLLGGILIVVSEITEQVQLNQQVNRAERLAALGELASSLAHEIKNPLTSIQGFVQMLPERKDDREYVEKTANILRKECRRLDELIDNLHSYAKPQVGQRQKFSLADLIDETVTLIRKQAEKSDVELVLDVPDELEVFGDSSKIKQVVMNLSLNSIEAISDRGTLTIQGERTRRNETRLTIRDTGVGMNEDQLEKIFNPFYTTKEEGTGLGMAITHRIVEDHGGIMNIDSSPGEGTTVEVLLPTEESSTPLGRNSHIEQ